MSALYLHMKIIAPGATEIFGMCPSCCQCFSKMHVLQVQASTGGTCCPRRLIGYLAMRCRTARWCVHFWCKISPASHAGGCPGLGADVHIRGCICLHGDADVPSVCVLVLRSWPEAHHADFPLDGWLQHEKPSSRRNSTDASHGWARVRLCGELGEQILAAGCICAIVETNHHRTTAPGIFDPLRVHEVDQEVNRQTGS